MIETLPVIHIFQQVIEELTFFTKIVDPNGRSCHSKVIFGNFGTLLGKYRAENYFPEGRSTKTSTATYFLINCMLFLLYIYIRHDFRISPLEYTLSNIACSKLTEL